MDSDSPPQPLDTFHFFPKLPPELRLRIWALNLPAARLIPIRCGADLSSESSSPSKADEQGCTSPAAIPANLHACPESRAHALSTRYSHALAFARLPGRLLVDLSSDVLYFPPRHGYMAASAQFRTFMSLCDPAELRHVRRIALHNDLFASRPYWSALAVGLTVECLNLVRERMPAVEEIFFVSRCGDDDADDEGGGEGEAARLTAQVQTAMRDLCATVGDKWEPPWWTIMSEPIET